MNEFLSPFMLLLIPGVPLLLAFPMFRARLSRPCLFALLPAIAYLLATALDIVPVAFTIKIPWLLSGTGLGIDGISRLYLSLSAILWITASLYVYRPAGKAAGHRFTTFFLLTMAANFGVILSTELVAFFTFLTLTGYGFYALLVDGGDEPVLRSGRLYLGFMILADLVLFEALLIAAATTDDLSFASVQQAMPASSASGLYLSLVLIGFAARAGIWPLHFWLSPAFRFSRPPVALLIAAVPIAMGLLGAVRWLPLGEIHSPVPGLMIQIMAAAAIFYAIVFAIMQAQLNTLPVCFLLFFTGLYTFALGLGLADPAAWRQYGSLVHIFIVLMVISLSVLVAIISWLTTNYHYPVVHKKQTEQLNFLPEHLSRQIMHWYLEIKTKTLSQIRSTWLNKARHLRQAPVFHILLWKKALDSSERFLQNWAIAITLFILLGIITAFISTS